jgi:tetraacyldisaccharide 4'-kinase
MKLLKIFYIVLFPLLFFCSLIYRLILKLKEFLYKKNILIRKRVTSTKIICVGNITVGGTGKTSTVIYLANELIRKGYKVVILTRGYKRKKKSDEPFILSDGQQILRTIQESGDEPYMLAKKLKYIPVIVGRKRYLSACLAIEKFGPDIILMDDGFQHTELERDLDIVMIDCLNPFGNNYLLPLGILREPLIALKRAKIVVLTNCNFVNWVRLNFIINKITGINRGIKIIRTAHKPCSITNYIANEIYDINWLRDKSVVLLHAIGNPKSFELTIESTGAKILNNYRFLDHHWYRKKELKKILMKYEYIITTEKDAVRIENIDNLDKKLLSKLFILNIELEDHGILIDTVEKLLSNSFV